MRPPYLPPFSDYFCTNATFPYPCCSTTCAVDAHISRIVLANVAHGFVEPGLDRLGTERCGEDFIFPFSPATRAAPGEKAVAYTYRCQGDGVQLSWSSRGSVEARLASVWTFAQRLVYQNRRHTVYTSLYSIP